MFGPSPIPPEVVRETLCDSWGLPIESIEYAPIGYGSYHWHAVGAGTRWLVTADAADDRPVVVAYEVAHRLGEKLEFVRSPQPRLDGGIVLAHDSWLVTVWPWVTGSTGTFSEPRTLEELAAVAACLRRLHDYTEILRESELIEDWEISGRQALMDVVAQQGSNTSAGPYSLEVADRIDANRSRIHALFARYDGLVARVRDTAELVITHGEPHVGNVVHTDSGAVLIDWDTVRWAPRERDLWWLPADGWRKPYGSDVSISESAMELYRLRWRLCDITDFAPALVTAATSTPDLDAAMYEVRRLLPL